MRMQKPRRSGWPTVAGWTMGQPPIYATVATAAFLVAGGLKVKLEAKGWIVRDVLPRRQRIDPARAAEIVAEFVRLKVDVILTHNTPTVLAAKQATSVIPIVFATAGDPVGLSATIRREVLKLDKEQPVSSIKIGRAHV